MPLSFSCLIIPFFIFFVFPDDLRCSCPPPSSLSCLNYEISSPFYTNTTSAPKKLDDPCRRHKVFCHGDTPMIQFNRDEQYWYVLKAINHPEGSIIIQDPKFGDQLQVPDCNLSYDFDPPFPLPKDLFLPHSVSQNQSFFNCMPRDYDFSTDIFYETYHLSPCKDYDLGFSNRPEDEGPDHEECWNSSSPLFEWRLLFSHYGDELSIQSASYSHHQGDWNPNCVEHDTRRDFKCLCNNECQSKVL